MGNIFKAIKKTDKIFIVFFIIENLLPVDTAKNYMIDICAAFLPCCSGHFLHLMEILSQS